MQTNFQLSTQGATWLDVNTRYTENHLPDRVPDTLAVTAASLVNLFNCPIGARGKIFQPEYGSLWHYFLQEPIDDITASKMEIAMIQAIARWEPRIKLDYSNTWVRVNYELPGYTVRIAGILLATQQPFTLNFTEQP